VYPSPFLYFAPHSVDGAVALLEAHLPDAKVLAGGQSLIPLMNLGLARPKVLIDINGLPDLAGVTEEHGELRIGALTRHHDLETSPLVRERCPLLAEAASLIGNIRVRHRGTLGGSLAHADPAAELPVVAAALDATLEIRGPRGVREIAAEKFFHGYLETDLAPGEIVTGVRVPALPPGTGYGLAELVRRAGDFALVLACALVEIDERRRCTRVSLTLGGVGPQPLRIRSAEDLLRGRPLTERLLGEAADAVSGEVAPDSDMHASAAYRQAMSRVMARRALKTAASRAGRAGDGRG
jgi:aerobic carbon-monoxide dehydrogenase medium subunit